MSPSSSSAGCVSDERCVSYVWSALSELAGSDTHSRTSSSCRPKFAGGASPNQVCAGPATMPPPPDKARSRWMAKVDMVWRGGVGDATIHLGNAYPMASRWMAKVAIRPHSSTHGGSHANSRAGLRMPPSSGRGDNPGAPQSGLPWGQQQRPNPSSSTQWTDPQTHLTPPRQVFRRATRFARRTRQFGIDVCCRRR